jgi:hypothetical protein
VQSGLAVVVGTTDGMLEAALTRQDPLPGGPRADMATTLPGTRMVNGELVGDSGTWEPGRVGRMLVQGLALSDAAAREARQYLFDRQLHGLASVKVLSSATALPYYDRCVNLVVADLDALGDKAPTTEEIDRVLGYEGVAYVKKNGKWSRRVKPTPASVDTWTHCFHDASRNSLSKDLTVAPPNAVRWLGFPQGFVRTGGPRTSDGVFVQTLFTTQGTAISRFR